MQPSIPIGIVQILDKFQTEDLTQSYGPWIFIVTNISILYIIVYKTFTDYYHSIYQYELQPLSSI